MDLALLGTLEDMAGGIMSRAATPLAAGAYYIGARKAAGRVKEAQEEEQSNYEYTRDFLNTQYYRDPLSTVGNRALLKSMDERMRDSADALQNRAVAGGATTENMLAAKQADNRVMSGLYSQLLQGEDARRDRLSQQQLALEQRHSANLQNNFLRSAQDWQTWGAAAGDAILNYGSTFLLDK